MGWRRFLSRKQWDRERREEIESYIQIETEDNIARGILKDEARFAARRKFGNTALVQEEIYGMNTIAFRPESLVKQIQQAVWSVNGALPVASPRTMQDIYSQSMAQTSFTLVMLAIAGAMALLLGLVGVYGVIAYAVSQRRREIGIRLAPGAAPGNLKRLFVRRGLVLAGIGVTIGLPASAGLTRLLKSLLFGISTLDRPAFAAPAAVLVLAAGLASFLPARRATAVDPVEVLKAE